MSRLLKLAAAVVCWALPLAVGDVGLAAVTYSGTGTGENATVVSASVQFTISGNTLTVVLTNTSQAATPSNGSVITGVIWDFDPDLTGSLNYASAANPKLTSGSHVYVYDTGKGDETSYKVNDVLPLGGTYSNKLKDVTLGDFGVSTTGGNGIFGMKGVLGIPGACDYGLVAPNTYTVPNPITNSVLIGNNGPQILPQVQNSITFSFTFTGDLEESQIVGAKFLVGTNGDHFDATERDPPLAPPAVPEPTSLAIWTLGMVAAGFGARRKLRRK